SDGCAKLSGATAGIGHHKRNEYRRETRCERTQDGVGQVPGLDPMMHGPLASDHLAFRGINRRWSIRDFAVAHSGIPFDDLDPPGYGNRTPRKVKRILHRLRLLRSSLSTSLAGNAGPRSYMRGYPVPAVSARSGQT